MLNPDYYDKIRQMLEDAKKSKKPNLDEITLLEFVLKQKKDSLPPVIIEKEIIFKSNDDTVRQKPQDVEGSGKPNQDEETLLKFLLKHENSLFKEKSSDQPTDNGAEQNNNCTMM